MSSSGTHIDETTGAVTFGAGGTLQTDVALDRAGPVTINVQARAVQTEGDPPRLAVVLGGQPVGELTIDSSSLADFAIATRVEHAGTTTLQFAVENHGTQTSTVPGAMLRIEAVWITVGVSQLLPARMNPRGTHLSDEAGGVTFWGSGELESAVPFDEGPVAIAIRAAGSPADEEFPRLAIELEGRPVGELTIASRDGADYTITTVVQGSAPASLRLRFDDHADVSDPQRPRTLHVERVWVSPGTALALNPIWPPSKSPPVECTPPPS